MTARRVQVQGDLFHGRVPAGAVYVGRAAPGLPRSRFHNPFRVGQQITDPLFTGAHFDGVPLVRRGVVEDAVHAVDLFAFWVMAKVPFTAADVRAELAGRDLACWCPVGQVCHGDWLLAQANRGDS